MLESATGEKAHRMSNRDNESFDLDTATNDEIRARLQKPDLTDKDIEILRDPTWLADGGSPAESKAVLATILALWLLAAALMSYGP